MVVHDRGGRGDRERVLRRELAALDRAVALEKARQVPRLGGTLLVLRDADLLAGERGWKKILLERHCVVVHLLERLEEGADRRKENGILEQEASVEGVAIALLNDPNSLHGHIIVHEVNAKGKPARPTLGGVDVGELHGI
jgi:hypothetical protein